MLIVEHQPFGYVPMPYIIRRNNDAAKTYALVELVTSTMINGGRAAFTDDELLALRNINAVSDQSLHKLFGGKLSLRAFQQNLGGLPIEKTVRPYMEERISAALPLLQKAGVPFFLRDKKINIVYESDRLNVSLDGNNIKMFFSLDERGLSYKLKLSDGTSDIDIYECKKMVELCTEPAVVAVAGKLMKFERTNVARLRPFVKNKRVIVPPDLVDKYMNTYVRNSIEAYGGVRAYGFDIVNDKVACKPIIRVGRVDMLWSMLLQFDYAGEFFSYGDGRRKTNLSRTDNGGYVFTTLRRQFDEEKRIVNLLSEIDFDVDTNGVVGKNLKVSRIEPYDIVELLTQHSAWFAEHGIDIIITDCAKRYVTSRPDINIQVDDSNDWFDLRGTVDIGDIKVPFVSLKRYIISRKREYVLPDGSIFILPQEWFTTWQEVFAMSSVEGDKLRVSRAHATLLPDFVLPQQAEQRQMQTSTTERKGYINGQLRDYQEVGFRKLLTWVENNRGGILADDMGLGKTLQMITLLSHLYAQNGSSNAPTYNTSGLRASLVVVPVSLIGNWRSELKRFAPQLSVCNYADTRLVGPCSANTFDSYHIVMITYGLLRNDVHLLETYNFSCLVMDESQVAKNPSSKIFRALASVKADHRFTMSGTPVENRLNDLWAQMSLVNPGLLGSQTFFRNYFETPIMRDNNEQRKQRLQMLVAPYIVRRTKNELLTELSELTVQEIRCTMPESHQRFYERIRSGCRNQLITNDVTNFDSSTVKFMALQAITRLRLAANQPVLLDTEYDGLSGKLETVIEHLTAVVSEGHKLLVFSSFVRDLRMLSARLDEMHIGHCVLTGATANRNDVIRNFTDNEENKVFLISLKAGGVGLNLTCADYVFVLNPWWNPQAEIQAISRAHRMGQKNPVFAYKFITEGTIEEKIVNLQRRKLGLTNDFDFSHDVYTADAELLAFNGNPLADLSEKDAMALFE